MYLRFVPHLGHSDVYDHNDVIVSESRDHVRGLNVPMDGELKNEQLHIYASVSFFI